MEIEATCVDCGKVFHYRRLRAPKTPMQRCPECARKHTTARYREHREEQKDIKAADRLREMCKARESCGGCPFHEPLNSTGCLIGNPVGWQIDDLCQDGKRRTE